MLARLFLLCALATLCGCATYRTVPWRTAVYEKGDIYVLDGTEVLKTAPLFTVHGTFKKFTFAVKREFKVYRHSDRRVIFARVLQEDNNCENSYYDYFADANALVASYDWTHKIENLTTRRSFRIDGAIANLRQAECRYVLAHHYEPERYTIYDKLTGKPTKLSAKAAEFIGDSWHTEFFVNQDSTRLFTTKSEGGGSNAFRVLVWDLSEGKAVVNSQPISFGDGIYESRVLYCDMLGENIAVIFGGLNRSLSNRFVLKEAIVGPAGLELKVVDSSEVIQNQKVIRDGPETATVLFRVGNRLRLKRINLKKGAIVSDETFDVWAPP